MVFFIKTINQKFLDFLLGTSAGIMIAASFWSLLKPAIELCNKLNKPAYIVTTIGFLLGALLIIITDILLEKKFKVDENSKKSLLLTFAIGLHNIPEGLAIGVAIGSVAFNTTTLSGALLLALGIGLQNFPEGACVALPLRKNGNTRLKAFIIGQASGIVEIIAGILGVLFVFVVEQSLPFLLSFSAGAMIAVACSELIPDSFKDNKILASFGLTIGFIIMMFLDISLS